MRLVVAHCLSSRLTVLATTSRCFVATGGTDPLGCTISRVWDAVGLRNPYIASVEGPPATETLERRSIRWHGPAIPVTVVALGEGEAERQQSATPAVAANRQIGEDDATANFVCVNTALVVVERTRRCRGPRTKGRWHHGAGWSNLWRLDNFLG